jgi:hypothetical protein
MTKKFRNIFLILIIAALSSGITAVLIYIGAKGSEPIPKNIIMSKVSPDRKITALIFQSHTRELLDVLGAGYRFYLGFRQNNITYIIDRDLSEGMGSYEGGISDIIWLNKTQLLIQTSVADRQSDLIFDLKEFQWKE